VGHDIVNGFEILVHLLLKPGGDLLFQRLSGSIIGAAWFHGRVRNGIGWVTGAMTTKLKKQMKDAIFVAELQTPVIADSTISTNVDGGIKRELGNIRTG
jgi:hypothetical protein